MSAYALLLPYVDRAPEYNLFDFNRGFENAPIPTSHLNYPVAKQNLPVYLCPSDPYAGKNAALNAGNLSYPLNFGWPIESTGPNGARPVSGSNFHAPNGFASYIYPNAYNDGTQNGGQPVAATTRIRDFVDGTSNTAAISEMLGNPGDSGGANHPDERRLNIPLGTSRSAQTQEAIYDECVNAAPIADSFTVYRGSSWVNAWGNVCVTYQHLMTPNEKTCFHNNDWWNSNFKSSAGSQHVGGVHVGLVDGSIRFVSDSVDRLTWWHLGARNDGRTVGEF